MFTPLLRAPPSGCRHLVLATSMWLALRAAPLQTSAILPMFPRKRRKDSKLRSHAFPSPAKRGKVPKAEGGAPCEVLIATTASEVRSTRSALPPLIDGESFCTDKVRPVRGCEGQIPQHRTGRARPS